MTGGWGRGFKHVLQLSTHTPWLALASGGEASGTEDRLEGQSPIGRGRFFPSFCLAAGVGGDGGLLDGRGLDE